MPDNIVYKFNIITRKIEKVPDHEIEDNIEEIKPTI